MELCGRQIVPTPGKPVRLTDWSQRVQNVTIWAFPENTGVVYIGGSCVRARAGERRGAPLNGGTRPDAVTFVNVNLYDVWIDAVVANEGVTWLITQV